MFCLFKTLATETMSKISCSLTTQPGTVSVRTMQHFFPLLLRCPLMSLCCFHIKWGYGCFRDSRNAKVSSMSIKQDAPICSSAALGLSSWMLSAIELAWQRLELAISWVVDAKIDSSNRRNLAKNRVKPANLARFSHLLSVWRICIRKSWERTLGEIHENSLQRLWSIW